MSLKLDSAYADGGSIFDHPRYALIIGATLGLICGILPSCVKHGAEVVEVIRYETNSVVGSSKELIKNPSKEVDVRKVNKPVKASSTTAKK